jgi:hypothetical protein
VADSRDPVAASVVDHRRAALTVLLSRRLVQQGLPDSTIELDLGELSKRVDEAPRAMGAGAALPRPWRGFIPGGSPTRWTLRTPVDGDPDLAIQAVALTLRDFG